VYNLFAAATIVPLLFIIPDQYASLHPGDGENAPFKDLDMDSQLRWVFYPAAAGWVLLSFWLANLRVRYRLLQNRILENE
jgi:heme exporter protein C